MFKIMITFLQFSGVFTKAFACCSADYVPYNGTIIIGGTYFFSAISDNFSKHFFVAYSHSSNPVRNTRMSPDGSFKWTLIAIYTELSTLCSLGLS